MRLANSYMRPYLLILLAFLALPAALMAAAGRQILSGHMSARVHTLAAVGRLDPATNLQLAVSLPVRDAAGLTNLLRQIQDPASPNFRHYLTPEQFADRFGASVADYEAAIAFAQAHGLTVTARHPNRLVLSVSGAARDIERAFHLTLRVYRHPTEARLFHAPDSEPSLDLAAPILHVSGLDDYARPHPQLRKSLDAGTNPVRALTGSSPNGHFIGKDFRNAYVPATTLDGTGQSIGLLQFDGYYINDITSYMATAGIAPGVVLTNVAVDGGVSTPSSGDGSLEVSLDIEMALSMAPGLSRIIVYEAPNPSPWVDLLSQMANDNLAKQLSCSWGGGPPDAASEQIFQQMAAQGQSFFNASGDSDAYTMTTPPDFPEESPNVTQVGGTTLAMSGAGSAYASETAWNRGGGVGSGGGISTTYAIPVYQRGVNMAVNQGSTTMRNLPDVAMTANNVYVQYGNGVQGWVGGTSCAAPLWAGFTALVNQQAASRSMPSVGFLNPAIYAIGSGTNYTRVFHDIATGNNFSPDSPAQFAATSGYDLCTGWGTPTGTNLIDALVSFGSRQLTILPASLPDISGPAGGPFSPPTISLWLTNAGAVSLPWSAGISAAWFTLTPANGMLPAGGTTNVVLTLTAAAANLPEAAYPATLWITNQLDGSVQGRAFTLWTFVVQNGSFETGDLTDWVVYGNTTNILVLSQAAFNSYFGADVSIVHSGTYGLFLGTPYSLGYVSQTFPSVAGKPYLLSFWLTNPSGGTPSEFLVQWNGTTLFDQTNMDPFGWTNMQFVVMATGTNSVLTFGAYNTPYEFALDDVSATLLALPQARSITVQTNATTVLWNTSANIHYQPQYTTNLAPAQWIDFGAPLLGTSDTLTVIDPSSAASQRFYRVILQP